MDSKEINTLMLLEAIDDGTSKSQRVLSKTLKLSLGSVNKLINDLCNQDIIKRDKHSNNKVKYQLTAKGEAAKIVLYKKHLSLYIRYYKKMKSVVWQQLEKLKNMSANNILFYGAGELCEIACLLSAQDNCHKIMIIDDNKEGEKLNGFSIFKHADIKNMAYDAVLITDLSNTHNIRTRLIKSGVPSNIILQMISTNEIAYLSN